VQVDAGLQVQATAPPRSTDRRLSHRSRSVDEPEINARLPTRAEPSPMWRKSLRPRTGCSVQLNREGAR
jgi:hypothetical protein